MAEEVCLSIRFVPGVAEKVAALVYGTRPDRPGQLRQVLKEVFEFVRRIGFEVTTTGARTMCLRGTTEQFSRAFNTAAPIGGWSTRGFHMVDQRALDAVAARLPRFIQDIALQRAFTPLSAIGDWPPPAPGPGRLALLDQVPQLLGADQAHARSIDGTGVTVMVLDSDFAFDHRFFVEREANCIERSAVTTPEASPERRPNGHGTAMAAIVLAVAPRAGVVGMKLRNNVLLEGIDAALDSTQGPRPDIMSISLAKDMCDRDSGTCWTELPLDLEHVADEINLAVAQGITVVVGTGNGDYGFPAAMQQVIAVGGVQVDPNDAGTRSVWEGGSSFRSKITDGDCRDRFVPDVCGLAGLDRGAYIVLPVPPGSSYERDFPLAPGLPDGSGWALFSGTSAATAQVAGICALILEHRPGLRPEELRNLLCHTAKDVSQGHASPLSNLPNPTGLAAAARTDPAEGFGLADASAALARANDAASTQNRPER